MLQVEDLHFAYDSKVVLDRVSFSASRGEIVALVGMSGSGKTTLFRIICGLMEPQGGHIRVGGASGPLRTSQTTYMRQDDLLLPWRTILDNLLLFGELGPKPSRELLEPLARRLLKQVGLEGYEKAYPKHLSGGMRQRVALARTLLQKRPLVLLDEPFASLDVIVREELYALLRTLNEHEKRTIVMVTHDFRDALALADRLLVLSKGTICAQFDLKKGSKAPSYETLSGQIRAAIAATV